MSPIQFLPRLPKLAIGPWLLVASLIAVVAGGPACQNDEIEYRQVCQWQCDYQQTQLGPATAPTRAGANLNTRDVVQVIGSAILEAQALGISDITVAVTDHLNNVLAVYDTDATTIDYSLITSTLSPDSPANTTFTAPANAGGTPLAGASANFAAFGARPSLNTALDGVFIPAGFAAISKAGTANYFSTQGNAFTTRTANTLIQQNFVPGEIDRPGGPLFAVQIAQLACSDINTRQGVLAGATVAPNPADLIGPRRLPVGFAADPGGLPLYKDGIREDRNNAASAAGRVPAGAVGIEFNGVYALDKNATNLDTNLEERIAYAATKGLAADGERQANRITVAGRALRFIDDGRIRAAGPTLPATIPIGVPNGAEQAAIQAFLTGLNNGTAGVFRNDSLFFPFTAPRPGVNFLRPQSGVILARLVSPATNTFADGEVLQQTADLATFNPRFVAAAAPIGPPTTLPSFQGLPSVNPLPGAGGLSQNDVSELLVQSLRVAEQTRAQTRTPFGGQARIDVAVVDLDGNVLGFARSRDALLDGIDVTIAKTRSAVFWSKANARNELENAVDPLGNNNLLNTVPFDTYVDLSADFLGIPRPAPAPSTDAPFNGAVAWSSIAVGGIANPNFPPGIADAPPGPLSRGPGAWSIFSTGIQTEVVLPGIALALCEEVPDLAAVLNALVPGTIPIAPLANPFDITNAGNAARVTFCRNARNALIGNPDPGAQTDCLQGVQDGPANNLINGLQNGFHIFQGAFPIYRGGQLIGAIGVSGDGAEQDDFVPFVALDNVFRNQLARGITNPIANAQPGQRADNIEVQNINLRYVICPTAPYLTSNDQSGCENR